MDNSPWEVAVVSPNLENRQDVAAMLFRLGIEAVCVPGVDQFRDLAGRESLGLVFCDRYVRGGDYRDVLSAVAGAQLKNDAKVVMMADLNSAEEYQKARQQGLFDVIPSPCRPTDIEWMVIQAKRNRRQEKDFRAPSRNLSLLRRAAGVGA